MGRISCGVQCTRTILFILNILFVMLGFTLLGFGIYINVSKKLDIALSDHINTKIIGGDALGWVGIVMIIVAVFTILLASFGCCGAVFKNRTFLYLYSVILSLLIITEIAALIVTISTQTRIRDSYSTGLRDLFIESYRDNQTDVQNAIEDIEREFKCCGVYNVTDYYTHDFTVPSSCHENQDFHKPIFHKGCADVTIDWLWNQFPIVGGVLGGILFIEMFGVISSIALGIAISHSSYDKIDY